jgi:hypothetical protein
MDKMLNANLEKVKVEQLYNKNQFVIYYRDNEKGLVAFQSYSSLIAVLKGGMLYINWDKWDYSKTTLKHLKLFVNEYTPFTYENKAQFTHLIRTCDRVITFRE